MPKEMSSPTGKGPKLRPWKFLVGEISVGPVAAVPFPDNDPGCAGFCPGLNLIHEGGIFLGGERPSILSPRRNAIGRKLLSPSSNQSNGQIPRFFTLLLTASTNPNNIDGADPGRCLLT